MRLPPSISLGLLIPFSLFLGFLLSMPSVVSENRKPKREGRVLALVLPIKSQMNLSFPIRQTKGLMILLPVLGSRVLEPRVATYSAEPLQEVKAELRPTFWTGHCDSESLWWLRVPEWLKGDLRV